MCLTSLYVGKSYMGACCSHMVSKDMDEIANNFWGPCRSPLPRLAGDEVKRADPALLKQFMEFAERVIK